MYDRRGIRLEGRRPDQQPMTKKSRSTGIFANAIRSKTIRKFVNGRIAIESPLQKDLFRSNERRALSQQKYQTNVKRATIFPEGSYDLETDKTQTGNERQPNQGNLSLADYRDGTYKQHAQVKLLKIVKTLVEEEGSEKTALIENSHSISGMRNACEIKAPETISRNHSLLGSTETLSKGSLSQPPQQISSKSALQSSLSVSHQSSKISLDKTSFPHIWLEKEHQVKAPIKLIEQAFNLPVPDDIDFKSVSPDLPNSIPNSTKEKETKRITANNDDYESGCLSNSNSMISRISIPTLEVMNDFQWQPRSPKKNWPNYTF